MKHATRARTLLERMAAIERMERGTLCRLNGRPQYNIQVWREGRNEVRYVRPEEVESVREALDGYRQFMTLAQQYADEIIRQTRREHRKRFPAKKTKRKKPSASTKDDR